MQPQPKKSAKNSKLTTIRSFIAGENVLQELLSTANSLTPVFFETSHNVDTDTILVNGKQVTMQEFEQILAQSEFSWVEEKQYDPELELIKDSELLAASRLNVVPACRGKERVCNKPLNEPVNRPTREQLHRLYLEAKLKELQTLETADLAIREKMVWWSKHNSPQ